MRIHFTTLAALAFAAAGVSLPASTASAQRFPYGIARFGLEYGGEKVLEFEYEDVSKPDVTAGGGLLLAVGGGAQLAQLRSGALDAQLTAGLKWRTIPAANNQDANWLRFPLEGLLFYRLPSGFRVGAGATVHFANALKASGAVLNDKVEFKNTPGILVQAEYVRRNLSFDVRYTMLDYEVQSAGSTVGASSIGIGIGFLFGKRATTSGTGAR
jgi:hypothetical protein